MPKTSSCPWIKIQDFIEISLWVSLENVTTRTFLTEQEGVELLECEAKGLTLGLPVQICSQGHLLLIRLGKKTRVPAGGDWTETFTEEFHATAKVMAIEKTESTSVVVQLRFYQFREDAWSKFTEALSRRMLELNRPMRERQK